MSLSPTCTLVELPSADQKSSYFLDNTTDFSLLDSSMSLPGVNDFSLLSSTFDLKPSTAPFSLPSPPSSNYTPDTSLDFDLESYTHCSPGSDLTFDQLGFAASTPESTTLISPKSASVPFASVSFDESFNLPSAAPSTDSIAAEALRDHHLQRYFHYKNLAAQAEAAAACQQDQFDALLAYTMVGDDRSFNPTYPAEPLQQQQQFYGVPIQPYSAPYNAAAPQQATAAAMHAQAHAHMQAHDVAAARAQEQRNLSMSYYMPHPQRLSFETVIQPPVQAVQPMWSRQSVASSITSPPYPSTPNGSQPGLPLAMSKTFTSVSLPTAPAVPVDVASRAASEGEVEMEDELEAGESDEQEENDETMEIANPHGGGRGYVPGKTPDDPKKKHKCTVCGRGFARAFNLKVCIQHLELRLTLT